MRAALVLFVLALFGCVEETPSPEQTCRSSATPMKENADTVFCTAGASIRLDRIGDGKTLRSLVICDCFAPRPHHPATAPDGGTSDGAPRAAVWR